MQQVFEVALGAAAMVDQVGRRQRHVLGDVKLVGPDALDDDVALAATDDEVVLFGIGPDVFETLLMYSASSLAGLSCPMQANAPALSFLISTLIRRSPPD